MEVRGIRGDGGVGDAGGHGADRFGGPKLTKLGGGGGGGGCKAATTNSAWTCTRLHSGALRARSGL